MRPVPLDRAQVFLLRELVRRDWQARYAGSALGFLWSFSLPLFHLALYTFVFALVLRVPTQAGGPPYGVLLFAGLMPWLAFQEGVQRATTALIDNANLVRKQRFPTELLVLAVVLSALLHQLVALGLFVVVLGVRGELVPGGLWLLPLALAVQLVLTVGLALLAATTQVFVRDLAPALGVGFLAWFYATPIVYPLRLVPAPWRTLLELNPLTPLVGLYRCALLGLPRPSLGELLVLAASAALVAALGLSLFRRLRPAFADEV